MATIQASVSGAVTATSTNNRTGRFKGAATSTIASGLMKGSTLPHSRIAITGSRVMDNTWADKALSSGTFAYLSAGNYVMRRVSLTISGVATNALKSGAGSKTKRSIHYVTTNRVTRTATAIVAGYWNIYEGTFSTAPTSANDSFGADHASTPSRATPGELTYKYAKPLPVNEDYKTKVNG